MEIINAAPGDRINIGRKGEHLARRVQFDLTAWAETYGDGRAELLYQRPGDLHAYPIAAQRQGNLLLWDITNVDTAQAGKTGRAEIRNGEAILTPEITFTLSDEYDLDAMFAEAKANGAFEEYETVDALLAANQARANEP